MQGESSERATLVRVLMQTSARRQIAQRYGQDVAREALHRSTSDLQLKEKARAYSFTYPPSIATSESHDPAVLGVNTLPLRG